VATSLALDSLASATGTRASTDDPLYSLEQESRTANLVRQLFYRAREIRRPLVGQWKKNYRVLNGRMWAPRAEPWIPSPEIPQMWPIVAARVAWMTDQRPMIEVMPSAIPFTAYADYYQILAEHMNATLAATFSDNLLDGEIAKALWDVDTYGIAYFRTAWEPWLADGLGDTVFRRVDPFTIYPDPWARTPSQLNYIIEAKVMSIEDLDRAFPGAARRIIAGVTEESDEAPHKLDLTVSQTGSRINYAPLSPGTRVWNGTPSKHNQYRETPVVTVLECWVRSHKHQKGNGKDSLSDSPSAITRTKESWRCIVVCGNAVLLDVDAEDVNGFSRHPYDRLVAQDTGEWYGPCLVEMLTSAQESICRTLANIEFNVALMGNPMLRESPRAGNRNKRVTNRPGQRLEGGPTDYQWLEPPQMHPDLAVQLIQFYKSEMESISGMSAIVRGFQPSGRNAQGVLDSVQDAAFVRIRATLREIERSLKSVGLKMAANIAEFYTEPRLVSLLGQDGQRTALALKSRHFYVPEGEQGKRIPLRFNLLADVGSQLATSRQARSAEANQLFNMGAIDVFEVLKAKQWPNWHEVATRVARLQAEAGTLGKPPGARQRTGTS